MKSNSEYKTAARAALKGNWGIAAITALVFSLLSGATAGFPGLGYFLIALPLTTGFAMTWLILLRDGDKELVDNLFNHTIKDYLHNAATMALRCAYIFLWSLLLVIPGIVKALSYSLVPFLIKDRPELSADETIDLSARMMDGHKTDLFLLYLSFISWFFLSLLTCGIGFFFLTPYVRTSVAAFYEDLRAELPEQTERVL